MDVKYYESHITIEPVFDERLDRFKLLCLPYGFRPATLMMKKRAKDNPQRSEYDTFCTGRDNDQITLTNKTIDLVNILKVEGVTVWRYKIEACLLDVKLKNVEDVE